MEDIKVIDKIMEKLAECAHSKLSQGIETVDAQEMGLVTDMIKDMAEAKKLCHEAEYYETVKEAMEESELKHYTEPRYRAQNGYSGNNMPNSNNTTNGNYNGSNGENSRCGGTRYYTEPMRNMMRPEMAIDYMDEKMGRAGMSRKMYMEHKENNPESSNTVDIKRHADDIVEDIMELVRKTKMSPHEKQTLKQTVLNGVNSI